MRSWVVAGIGFLLVIGFAISHMMRVSTEQPPVPTFTSASTKVEQLGLATQFLDLLDAGAYEVALNMAAPEVVAGLGDGKIQKIWEGLPARLGPRQSRGALRELQVDGRSVLGSRLQFSDQAMDVHILFNDQNLISGFQLKPEDSSSR